MPNVERLSFVWLDSTAAAVEAIARWGLPAGGTPEGPFDLHALERYLEVQSLVFRFAEPDGRTACAVGALARLRSLPEYREADAVRSEGAHLLGFLMDHRLLLAALVLTGFGVFATWRAPESIDEEALEELTLGVMVRRALLDSRAS